MGVKMAMKTAAAGVSLMAVLLGAGCQTASESRSYSSPSMTDAEWDQPVLFRAAAPATQVEPDVEEIVILPMEHPVSSVAKTGVRNLDEAPRPRQATVYKERPATLPPPQNQTELRMVSRAAVPEEHREYKVLPAARIVHVDLAHHYAVLDCSYVPRSGKEVPATVMRNQQAIARLMLGDQRRGRYLVADIIDGAPRRGDVVHYPVSGPIKKDIIQK
ncbi:MAG: hypothetical protein EOL87_00020 [Spartobacteria bacterium]|nr:hypothetical protein [Spartobacteria bacterium]